MAQLTLVKTLSHLQEEQHHSHTYLETNGLRLLRGSLTELSGPASCGKASLALMLLAALTQAGEVCAVVDLNNGFNPVSATASQIVLKNLLWVRCGGNVEHAFKSVDLLIQARNFGMIWLDLSEDPGNNFHYIPGSYWYRFRTRIKNSQTVLVATSARPLIGAASSQSHQIHKRNVIWSGQGNFKLLQELRTEFNTTKPFFIQPESLSIEAKY